MVSPGDASEIARAGVLNGELIEPEAESLPVGETYKVAALHSTSAIPATTHMMATISPSLTLVRFKALLYPLANSRWGSWSTHLPKLCGLKLGRASLENRNSKVSGAEPPTSERIRFNS